jgi:ribosomal protein S18 acetylase RimI-like enzyme
MSRRAAGAIDVRRVDEFDQDAIRAITEPIFGDEARRAYLEGLVDPAQLSQTLALIEALPKPQRIRVGAFQGERLVGYTTGWFENGGGGRFYIGSSAVQEEHRRGGIYTRLLTELHRAVGECGGTAVSSQHVATNNAVLIAKLKLGYVIAGTEYVEPMGLLVRLVLHLEASRAALFRERTGMLVPPKTPTRT